MIADAIFGLVDKIVDKIVEETGADRAVTYEAAMTVATEWVAAERQAVTDARARAVSAARKSKR